MSGIDKIIGRVRKMLAVSKSDNEHEAALAASRAAKLMAEYDLTEAMLRVDDDSRAAEKIVDDVKLDDARTRKRVAWKETVARAVADSLGCHMYLWTERWQGKKLRVDVKCFGREGATQAWRYTTQYLCNEIDRLADKGWDDEGPDAEAVGQSARKWKNAFRVGAAQAIATRLIADRAIERDERRERARQAAPTPESQIKALAILETDEQEVETAYAKRSEGFRTSRGIGTVSSRSGYHAGTEAGANVHLGGGRAALAPGQGVLK